MCTPRDPFGVRNLHARAVSSVGPRMERASDALRHDVAAYTQVRAEMHTVGVEHLRLTRLGPEQHKIQAEVSKRLQFSRRHLVRVGDDEPTVGIRKWEPAS